MSRKTELSLAQVREFAECHLDMTMRFHDADVVTRVVDRTHSLWLLECADANIIVRIVEDSERNTHDCVESEVIVF